MSVQICKPTDICVNHVEGRVTNVAVELRTGAESVEIQDVPNDYDEVGEVEDNEEKYDGQERVDLVVLVMVVGLLSLYEQQQTDVGIAQDDDGQNCPAGRRNSGTVMGAQLSSLPYKRINERDVDESVVPGLVESVLHQHHLGLQVPLTAVLQEVGQAQHGAHHCTVRHSGGSLHTTAMSGSV